MVTRAILTDLDRTLTGPDLALDARIPPRLAMLRARGIRVVVVTGRTLEHVVAMRLAEFSDAIVAENGAVLRHANGMVEVEAHDFAQRCRDALGPLAVRFHWGRSLASGPRELAPACAHLLREHHVAHGASYNAEELMLLPPGVDKATGARRALAKLDLTLRDAVAIGDGENDVPMLLTAGDSAAPANAHAAARAAAKRRLDGAYADGFLELSDLILASTLPPEATR